MIKIIIFGVFLLVQNFSFSQKKYWVFANFGVKYTPIEYLGGPAMGISVDNPNKKLKFNYRKDIIFSIGKNSYENNLDFEITDYLTYDYFDVGYKTEKKINIFAGVGWIYSGKNENVKLNIEHGYYSATLGITYPIDWLTIEIRGDIPLGNYNKAVNNGFLFPVSFALYYHFRPQRND